MGSELELSSIHPLSQVRQLCKQDGHSLVATMAAGGIEECTVLDTF